MTVRGEILMYGQAFHFLCHGCVWCGQEWHAPADTVWPNDWLEYVTRVPGILAVTLKVVTQHRSDPSANIIAHYTP